MSYIFLRDSEPISRKEHYCSACEYLLQNGIPKEIDWKPDEWRAIERAKANGWKIQKGEKYYNQVGIYDGDFQNFKGIIEIHNILRDNDYYEWD